MIYYHDCYQLYNDKQIFERINETAKINHECIPKNVVKALISFITC